MRTIFNIFIIILLCGGIAACDSLLNPKPASSLTGDKFWKSEADVENGVTAMYSSLSVALARGYYDWGELRGATGRETSPMVPTSTISSTT